MKDKWRVYSPLHQFLQVRYLQHFLWKITKVDMLILEPENGDPTEEISFPYVIRFLASEKTRMRNSPSSLGLNDVGMMQYLVPGISSNLPLTSLRLTNVPESANRR